jgi:antitoxin component of MazEF toxin-antitoxin module
MSEVLSHSGIPLYVSRVRRWGNSLVLILPVGVRERLLLLEGGLVGIRVAEPFAVLRSYPPPTLPDPKKLAAEMLPPPVEEVRRHA